MKHKTKKRKLKKELLAELEEKEKAADHYHTQFQYLQADFENYKKNAAKEKEIFVKFANEELILKLLTIIDEFESAFAALENAEYADAEGFKIIYNNSYKILEDSGLKQIKSVGKKFDHNEHEAVMQEVSDEVEEGIILEEFQKGYLLHDRVIRHAKVKVAKNK